LGHLLQKVGPRRDEGSQGRRCQAARIRDHCGHEGCHLRWHRIFSSSRTRAQNGLCLLERPINAPRGAGSRHCRHARWRRSEGTSRCGTLKGQSQGCPRGGAVLHAPCRRTNAQRACISGASMVGTFGLFWLPRGRPWCFFPASEDPAVAEEEEGSMAQGKLSSVLE
jgi:hypothetical protein